MGQVTETARPGATDPRGRRRVETRTVQILTRRFQADETVEPLDVGRLAGMTWADEIVSGTTGDDDINGSTPRGPVEFVEIVDTTGERIRYPLGRLVDVYHPATEMKERIPAADLRPGMLMIILATISTRTCSSACSKPSAKSETSRRPWPLISGSARSRQPFEAFEASATIDSLASAGLRVKYEAVVGWFNGGEDEVIAPLDEADFAPLQKQVGSIQTRR